MDYKRNMRGETGNGKARLRISARLYNSGGLTFQTGASNKMQQRDAMCHVRILALVGS